MSKQSVDHELSLLTACKRGDRFAQRRLYNQYAQAMYHTVYRLTNDKHLSEDILQDAFIKVFKALGSFRHESTLGAWIKRITVNTAITELRKNKKTFSDSEEIPEREQMQRNVTEEKINVEWIDQAIRNLPDKCRMVFTMVAIEGYKHREVATILDISESTSKTQYMRAKKLLTAILKPQL